MIIKYLVGISELDVLMKLRYGNLFHPAADSPTLHDYELTNGEKVIMLTLQEVTKDSIQ